LAWSLPLWLSFVYLHLIFGILFNKEHVLFLSCSHLLLAVLLDKHRRVHVRLLSLLLLVHLQVRVTRSRWLYHWTLRWRDFKIMWLAYTLIGHGS
jgi:hypothetical protein